MLNLLADLPGDLPEELITVLAKSEHVRVERIVSMGHASPEGFWYDQDENEWVVVLKGAARLQLEGDAEAIELRSGDCVMIPAKRRHRVEWTAPDVSTVWLAVFYKNA